MFGKSVGMQTDSIRNWMRRSYTNPYTFSHLNAYSNSDTYTPAASDWLDPVYRKCGYASHLCEFKRARDVSILRAVGYGHRPQSLPTDWATDARLRNGCGCDKSDERRLSGLVAPKDRRCLGRVTWKLE